MGPGTALYAQVTLDEVQTAAMTAHLTVFGALHPKDEDTGPEGVQTIVMLGPHEPGFWPHFTASDEYKDGAPDPMNRWSTRVITALARNLNALPLFPFGGPPYQPFIRWAQCTGRSHLSPVGLLVHDVAGLMVSYRGALGFAERLNVPAPAPNPCHSCPEQPCRTACPVDAFAGGAYDVPACKADLDRDGNDCLARGCAVRRICPVSQTYGRVEAQSAFHMEAFK